MKTRFVLIETSHAGNVGAAARAMKVMGFEDMVLVAPRYSNVLRKKETIERASGAVSVLENARIVETLDEALDGVTHMCATAMIGRDFGPPTRTPREHFDYLLAQARAALAAEQGQPQAGADQAPLASSALVPALPSCTAFLFGTERFGMRNDDVYRCNVALQIPSNPAFGSLNLGAAVQVIAYEWRLMLDSVGQTMPGHGAQAEALGAVNPSSKGSALQGDASAPADAAALAGMLGHWEKALVDIGFLDPNSPKKLMPTLNQMFNRAQLSERDVHILRGIAKAMLDKRQHAQQGADQG